MTRKGKLAGRRLTSGLLDILERIAAENHIRTDVDSWPRSADALTKRLRVISSNLREGLGINISVGKIRTGTIEVYPLQGYGKTPYTPLIQFETVPEVNAG